MMRYLSIAALSIVAALTFGTQTHAATPPDSCFAFNAGTGTITDYYNHEANNSANPACTRDVDIPSTIGGTPVTTIGALAFYNNQLTSVTIPSSVTIIGNSAFRGNQLTAVTIPASVTSIGQLTFTDNQLSTVNIQNGVTTIGDFMFSSNQLTTLTIPSTVSSIGSRAFSNNQLTNVTIPSSVTSIGTWAFRDNRLTSVTIENSAASMSHSIFQNNPITTMTIDGTTLSEQTPTVEPACYLVSGTDLYDYTGASPLVARDNGVLCGREVSVPSGVTDISPYAFEDRQLTSVVLPDTLTTIEPYAFWGNYISEVTFGSNLTSIGMHAFLMNSIESVTVPTSLTDIGIGAFDMQNQWGDDIEYGRNGAPSLYSGDPSEVQEAYDSLWFVAMYTQDPSNPSNLLSFASDEESWMGGDSNGNGVNDSTGGYIINPARASIQYVDSSDADIQETQHFTGTIGDTYIHDYFVSNGPQFPAPVDSYSPTPAELTAVNDAFDVYYRIGDTVTIDPPAISGYITPEPQTFVLGAADNTFSYVYAAADSPGGGAPATPVSDEDELADTGISSIVYAVSALAMTSLGALILTRRV